MQVADPRTRWYAAAPRSDLAARTQCPRSTRGSWCSISRARPPPPGNWRGRLHAQFPGRLAPSWRAAPLKDQAGPRGPGPSPTFGVIRFLHKPRPSRSSRVRLFVEAAWRRYVGKVAQRPAWATAHPALLDAPVPRPARKVVGSPAGLAALRRHRPVGLPNRSWVPTHPRPAPAPRCALPCPHRPGPMRNPRGSAPCAGPDRALAGGQLVAPAPCREPRLGTC